MKKLALIGVAGFVVIAAAGIVAFRTIAAKEPAKAVEVSEKSAKALRLKIDKIKAAQNDPQHKRGSSQVEVSDGELESYLLYSLKEDIPAKIDSADVQLTDERVALDTQITFSANATGNPVMDALVGGTHNLFVKGRLVAREGRGKFDLEDVRVDGIPVPNFLIQTLIKRYVKPKYPDVDLNEPFDVPWGIQELRLQEGKAIVIY